MKMALVINVHKALVVPIVLLLMWCYDNWSTEAFVYLSFHGTYGLLWLVKSRLYPDKRFEEVLPVWVGLLFVFLPLAGYYLAPFLLISRHVTVPPPLLAFILTCYTCGMFLHHVSDAQKYYTLQVRKGLITTGLFSRTRNPNYLGEILIYSALALMAQHWLPLLIVLGWVGGYFLRNMWAKDRSLSRYPEFAPYRQRTGLLLPKILP